MGELAAAVVLPTVYAADVRLRPEGPAAVVLYEKGPTWIDNWDAED